MAAIARNLFRHGHPCCSEKPLALKKVRCVGHGKNARNLAPPGDSERMLNHARTQTSAPNVWINGQRPDLGFAAVVGFQRGASHHPLFFFEYKEVSEIYAYLDFGAGKQQPLIRVVSDQLVNGRYV